MVDFGFQTATGVGDPVSTNQTMGDGFAEKDLWVDLAYVDFHPIDNNWTVNVIGGKMKTPFAVMSKSELLWDPDLRPEGIAIKFTGDVDGLFSIFGTLGGFYVDEVGAGADPSLWGSQLGVIIPICDDLSFTAGGGYYDYGHVKGAAAFYDNSLSGNSADGFGNFNEDFDQVEAFAECAFDVADQPVSLFGNYAFNAAAQKHDTAWLTGVKVGNAKEQWDLDFRYQYKIVEKDSVFGTFTDSDFGGGGTNAKGHEFNVGMALAKNWKVAASYFINTTGIAGDHNNKMDYDRFQLDFKFKF